MHYIVKFGILLYSLAAVIIADELVALDIIIILALASITLLIHQLKKGLTLYVVIGEAVVLLCTFFLTDMTVHLLPLLIFDVIYTKKYYGLSLVGILIYIERVDAISLVYLGFYLLAGVAAYLIRVNEDKQEQYNMILDNERRMRYDLEMVKNQLIRSNQEIEALTKVNVQNRIARDLHDGIGHTAAGIVMQLQAAETLMASKEGQEQGRHIISYCVKALQKMIETIRETVHNMYSDLEHGPEIIQQVVDGFTYCPVDYQVKGDLDRIPKHCYEGLIFILKEALTNTSKHSDADMVKVTLSVTYSLIRLVVQDNGHTSEKIEEGLGLRSMRDRAKQMNGNLVYDYDTGMQIVCTLPIMKEA